MVDKRNYKRSGHPCGGWGGRFVILCDTWRMSLRKLIRLVVILLALACAWLLRSCSTYGSDDFDRDRWRAAKFETGERCGMAEDVRKNIVLPGMTEAEVRGVLGAPARVDSRGHQEYMLGMCSMADPATLDARYGPDGRLQGLRITEH